MKQHYFDLNLLPTAGQRKELRAFILKRSENLSLSTIDGDTIQFKVLARFMKEKFPYLDSFSAVDEGKIIDISLHEVEDSQLKNRIMSAFRYGRRMAREIQMKSKY